MQNNYKNYKNLKKLKVLGLKKHKKIYTKIEIKKNKSILILKKEQTNYAVTRKRDYYNMLAWRKDKIFYHTNFNLYYIGYIKSLKNKIIIKENNKSKNKKKLSLRISLLLRLLSYKRKKQKAKKKRILKIIRLLEKKKKKNKVNFLKLSINKFNIKSKFKIIKKFFYFGYFENAYYKKIKIPIGKGVNIMKTVRRLKDLIFFNGENQLNKYNTKYNTKYKNKIEALAFGELINNNKVYHKIYYSFYSYLQLVKKYKNNLLKKNRINIIKIKNLNLIIPNIRKINKKIEKINKSLKIKRKKIENKKFNIYLNQYNNFSIKYWPQIYFRSYLRKIKPHRVKAESIIYKLQTQRNLLYKFMIPFNFGIIHISIMLNNIFVTLSAKKESVITKKIEDNVIFNLSAGLCKCLGPRKSTSWTKEQVISKAVKQAILLNYKVLDIKVYHLLQKWEDVYFRYFANEYNLYIRFIISQQAIPHGYVRARKKKRL